MYGGFRYLGYQIGVPNAFDALAQGLVERFLSSVFRDSAVDLG